MSGKEILILFLTFTFEVEMIINQVFLSNRKMSQFHNFLQIGQAVKNVLSNTNRLFNFNVSNEKKTTGNTYTDEDSHLK